MAALRQRACILAQQYQQGIGEARGLLFRVNTSPERCPTCLEEMGVEKSTRRHLCTLAHGRLEVRETVRVCPRGCRYEDGTRVRARSSELARYGPPGGVFGYDVIVHVGLQRFLFHRQREEIRQELAEQHDIVVSTGTISDLARRFLTYLEELHRARAPVLAEALARDGGWPLHVDATGEDGRGTLLVLFAGWRRWVLGSFKIPTERAERILPCLHAVADRFGNPRAVMRDLGRAMVPVVASFVKERDSSIPVLSCHFHFLQDVGKDLLEEPYGTLRTLLRNVGVRARLRTLTRDLGRKLGEAIDQARGAVRSWQQDAGGDHHLPEEAHAARGVVRSLAQWVLDFQAQGSCRNFPFDRPLLRLYERCTTAARATDAFLRHPPEDPQIRRTLERLARTLDLVVSHDPFRPVVASLKMRATLFDELRAVLRLRVSSATAPEAEGSVEELRDIQQALEDWERELRARRPARGPAEDRREAIDLVLDHLERHGETLFGHALLLPASVGGGVRLVDRTNNIEESFFQEMKHGERRRSGRKVLTQDLERLPPTAALVPNLRKPDYVALLCGSLEGLPTAFAELDAKRERARRKGRPQESATTAPQPTIESASLPAADRPLIRSEAMDQRILDAARSRAPRLRGTG